MSGTLTWLLCDHSTICTGSGSTDGNVSSANAATLCLEALIARIDAVGTVPTADPAATTTDDAAATTTTPAPAPAPKTAAEIATEIARLQALHAAALATAAAAAATTDSDLDL